VPDGLRGPCHGLAGGGAPALRGVGIARWRTPAWSWVVRSSLPLMWKPFWSPNSTRSWDERSPREPRMIPPD
jgi:hypothetical protein